MFGPDKMIWELDKSSATAAHVLGQSYMKSFYKGALPHGRLKRSGDGRKGSSDVGTTAWVNGQEVREGQAVIDCFRLLYTFTKSTRLHSFLEVN